VISEEAVGGRSRPDNGGGIYNDFDGTLTLRDSTILGNSTPFGADVYNAGQLSLYDSVIGILYP